MFWRPKRDDKIAELIKPPRYVFTGHDESLEVKARQRREIAASLRTRSALVAAGSRSGDLLKIVRKA